MNDRFKFRVWFAPDWQKPEMIYEAEHTYDNRCRNKGSFHHESFGEILEDKDCIVMQSTGLKDKNGKLIYESDVIKTFIDRDIVVGVVAWCDKELRYYLNTTDYFGDKYVTDFDIYKSLSYEVIGNVHQNKDLLNA